MKGSHLLLLVCCYLLVGCGIAASYKSIKPVFPEIGNPMAPKTIDTLQPVFTWEPLQEANLAYDFILYEGIGSLKYSWEVSTGRIGRELYYRESLTEPRCTLEQPLKPKTEYYWSVRVRRGNTTSEWALYDYTLFTGLGIGKLYNRHFVFRTPE